MKKIVLVLFIITCFTWILSAQYATDSLVKFSELKYHSDFEQSAIRNFVSKSSDTFDIFLAIDENIIYEEAKTLYVTYTNVYDVLKGKKLDSKNISKKIKTVYPVVHDYFLKKYNTNDYFPIVFKTGSYNCVTASVLYAMVFDKLNIPYKVMASSEHAYLIANPGENSMVIETTNPNFEKAIFTGEYKQQYVNYLRGSKLISESEYKNKSTEEIFEEKFNEVKEVKFTNLIGIQYYNKALSKFQNNEYEEAYKLCQKAYYFFPDIQIKALLSGSLLFEVENCKFDKVSDIDYLAHLSRFENINSDLIIGVFNNILNYYLQYTDKDNYCDSLFQRLIPQITNKTELDEISFSYYWRMSQRFFPKQKAEFYILNALKIKGNHKDANTMLTAFLYNKFSNIYEPQAILDTIESIENKIKYEQASNVLKDYKRIAWLKLAEELYKDNKPTQGDKYLLQFESDCTYPADNQLLGHSIETTYRSVAVYYYYKNQKEKAKTYIDKALKYVPNSILIKSAIYKE
jgi:hypothetical protein